jgi:hypothetical protein
MPLLESIGEPVRVGARPHARFEIRITSRRSVDQTGLPINLSHLSSSVFLPGTSVRHSPRIAVIIPSQKRPI